MTDHQADPTISLVIRTLNEADHLPRLLEASLRQSTAPDEIILVDSGSTDGTVAIAESFGCRIIHIPPSDFTFGRALNWGCAAAKGELLVFASAHVYPLDDSWLERLTAPFSDADVSISYGGQTGDHRSNFAELQLLEQWFPDESDMDQDHPFSNNANCAVRRDVWERIGYDEQLTGLEDLAFAQAVLDEGGRLVYIASARIAHVHEEATRQTFNRYRREAMAYRQISGERALDAAKAARLCLSAVRSDVQAAMRAGRVGDAPSAAKFRVAQFAGAWHGYRTAVGQNDKVIKRMYYSRH